MSVLKDAIILTLLNIVMVTGIGLVTAALILQYVINLDTDLTRPVTLQVTEDGELTHEITGNCDYTVFKSGTLIIRCKDHDHE